MLSSTSSGFQIRLNEVTQDSVVRYGKWCSTLCSKIHTNKVVNLAECHSF